VRRRGIDELVAGDNEEDRQARMSWFWKTSKADSQPWEFLLVLHFDLYQRPASTVRGSSGRRKEGECLEVCFLLLPEISCLQDRHATGHEA
jgi:hypothetical protein